MSMAQSSDETDYRRDYLDVGFDPEYVVGEDPDKVMCAICTNVCEDPAEV